VGVAASVPDGGITPNTPFSCHNPLPRRWSVGSLTYSAAGLAVLFCWLLGGDFAWNVKERTIFPLAQLTLRRFDAPVWFVGLLVGSIPAAIGLLLGPSIGVKSDRHRGRWGRRIPFILIPTPFIVLAMLGLAATPNFGHWIHLHGGSHVPKESICSIASFALFWTVLELATIITNALFGGLINDVVPAAVVGRFFGLFRLVGLAVAIIFNLWLMGKADAHYQLLFAVLGLLYGAGITLMCLGVKEGEYPPPPPIPEADKAYGMLGWLLMYIQDCFSKPYYLWFFATITFGLVMFVPVNSFMVLHARSVGMSDKLFGKCQALGYFGSLLLSYPLGILADKFHPLRLGVLFTILYAAIAVIAFFFGSTVPTFFVALACHTVISGCYITGTASLAQRLLPPLRFAELASAAGVCSAIALMLVPPMLGAFVQRMGHDYSYVFLVGSVLAALGAVAHIVLLRQFQRLGGDNEYVAP